MLRRAVFPLRTRIQHLQSSFLLTDISREIGLRCHDPTFFLINTLARHKAKPQELTRTLAVNQLTRLDYPKWLPVATAPNLPSALAALANEGVILPRNDALDIGSQSHDTQSRPQPPTWLVLHLLQNRVSSARHTQGLLPLVFYHHPAAPTQLQPSLYIFAAYWFSTFRLIAPLRRIVKAFLSSPSPLPDFYFNLLLRALSRAPRSAETNLLALALLRSVKFHHYNLSHHTFNDLCRPGFITLPIAKALEAQMHRQNLSPTFQQLKSFLILRARLGHRKRAGKYLSALQAHQYANRHVPVAQGPHPKNHWLARVGRTKLDTIYMTSFRDLSKLHERLDQVASVQRRLPRWKIRRMRLAQQKDLLTLQAPSVSTTVVIPEEEPTSIIPHLQEETIPASESQTENPTQAPVLSNQIQLSSSSSLERGERQPLGITEWTTALYVASRDKSVSSSSLHSLFSSGLAFGDRIPMFSFTVAVKGFLRKWDVGRALEVWRMSREKERCLALDTFSVGVGVTALTLGGRPGEGLALLERVYMRAGREGRRKGLSGAGSSSSNSNSLSVVPVRRQNRKKRVAQVNLQALNQFMISLQRIGRPDAVIALWEDMEVLYGVSPDVYTFNILLKTARFARKISSGTIRGALAGFGFGRFWGGGRKGEVREGGEMEVYKEGTQHKRRGKPWVARRDEARQNLEALLSSDPDSTPPNVNGLWGGELASRVALRVGRDMLLWNYPELRDVEGPRVRPLRKSGDAPALSPVSDLIQSVLGRRGVGSSTSTSPTSGSHHQPLLGSSSRTIEDIAKKNTSPEKYARIVPSDLTFRLYIDLLGMENQSGDIPVILGWMKYLNIKPSKTTLGTALVYWAEVAMDAPLIEMMKVRVSRGRSVGGSHLSMGMGMRGGRDVAVNPYEELWVWMEEWVGEGGMPESWRVGEEMRRIEWVRNLDYLDVVERRLEAVGGGRDEDDVE